MASTFGILAKDIRDAAYGIDIPVGSAVDLQLDTLILKAEARVLVSVPSLAARIEGNEELRALAKGVVEDMVLRVVKNPRSMRSIGLDDFQATVDNSTSTGLLYVSPAEVEMLSPRSRGRSFGTIRTAVPSWRLPHA